MVRKNKSKKTYKNITKTINKLTEDELIEIYAYIKDLLTSKGFSLRSLDESLNKNGLLKYINK